MDRKTETSNGGDAGGDSQIQFNADVHDEVSGKYDRRHGEIFNPVEQQRLRDALEQAAAMLQTDSETRTALDCGCGSGNLTKHLLEIGFDVVSADISERFLRLIEEKFSHTGRSQTFKLNGEDLSGIPDGRFDLAATYSVLHHVPDYLSLVAELCRVVKPGGILYIDHELSEAYWHKTPAYIEFLRRARPRVDWRRYLRLLFDVCGYKHIVRRLINPRYKREGDIHVWPDDHIEWGKIDQVVKSHGFEVLLDEEYLLYKAIYNRRVYEEYRDRCVDVRVLVCRKKR